MGKLAGLLAATTLAAAAMTTAGPAGADQVSDLKTQATQVARALVLEQLQVETHQQQYDVDGAKVAQDEAKISATQNQIATDTGRVNRDRQRLRREALAAYINMDPVSAGSQVLFVGTPNAALAKAQYEEVVSGDANLTIDALRADESGLSAQRATLEQQESVDQSASTAQAAQANAARQTQGQLSSEQKQITGQLAVAVTQQQVAQAAAAEKAVQAAQAAAAAAAAARSVPSASGSRTTSTTQVAGEGATPGAAAGTGSSDPDPALPPFLQCVLRVESGGDYQAVSPGGAYMGGFQFSQPTWNEAAQLAGMPQLVNVPPNEASPADQDDLAIALYNADGQQPWDDSCRNG